MSKRRVVSMRGNCTKAERRALGLRIAATRRKNGTDKRTVAQKKYQSECQLVAYQTPAGLKRRAKQSRTREGKKHHMTTEGRAGISKNMRDNNPMHNVESHAKQVSSNKAHWAAIPRRDRLTDLNAIKRYDRAQLRLNDLAAYRAELERVKLEKGKKIAKGQRAHWRTLTKKERKLRGTTLHQMWVDNHDEMYAKTFTPEYCANLSKIMKGVCPPGRPTGPRTVWYRGKNGRIAMRSKTEVVYAKWMDKQGIKWLYEAVTFCMGRRSWTPDFYLPETDEFVEVKGWLLPAVAKKINHVQSHLLGAKLRMIHHNDVLKLVAA